MTEADIQCLKESIDQLVEIRTVDEEYLIARILFVSHCDEYDEHEVTHDIISSNKIEEYAHLGVSGGYVLDFEKIVSVMPLPSVPQNP
jgi:hypothetical protein